MALIKEGYIVHGGARRVNLMDDLVAAGGHAIEMDVTDDVSVKADVQRLVEEHGCIDGLFASAGYGLRGPVELHKCEEVTKQFDTNIVGVGRVVSLSKKGVFHAKNIDVRSEVI